MPYIIDENGNISKGESTPEKVDSHDHGYISDDYLEGSSNYSISPHYNTYIADSEDHLAKGIFRKVTEQEMFVWKVNDILNYIRAHIVHIGDDGIALNMVQVPCRSSFGDTESFPLFSRDGDYTEFMFLPNPEEGVGFVFKRLWFDDGIKCIAFKPYFMSEES